MVTPIIVHSDTVDSWELSFSFYELKIKKSKFVLLVERFFDEPLKW